MGLSQLMILPVCGILELGLIILVFVSQVLGLLVIYGGKRSHKSIGEICYVLILLG